MSLAASEPGLIGLDWGTTSLRAFLIDRAGQVLNTVQTGQGIMHVDNRDFDGVFRGVLRPWLRELSLPVIASGMITSRNGWVETPYLPVPTNSLALAQALVTHRASNGTALHFVTGVSTEHGGIPDIMRGEETQIVGAVASGLGDGIYVLPGTHSKWVTVGDGRITGYRTYMTGEVFAALKGHTILGALMTEAEFSPDGFDLGVTKGLQTGADLLHRIFSARTLPLFGKITDTMVADYLSGLLIGAEVAAGAGALANGSLVTLIGRGDLAERYQRALKSAGFESQHAPEDIAARGLYDIAKTAGLLT